MLLITISLILAYLLGSISSGLIIGKTFYKIDIREHGSKNLGATNSFRTLGFKPGITVTLMDILKGTLATLLPGILGADIHPLIVGCSGNNWTYVSPISRTLKVVKLLRLQLASCLHMIHSYLF